MRDNNEEVLCDGIPDTRRRRRKSSMPRRDKLSLHRNNSSLFHLIAGKIQLIGAKIITSSPSIQIINIHAPARCPGSVRCL
ncbi:hypothetical protein KCP71_00875 [Salmonella enterica subsp. enterica]|nr:hypothetical protein KCP71_00875 [Salmonella enterica subsp. enterica]